MQGEIRSGVCVPCEVYHLPVPPIHSQRTAITLGTSCPTLLNLCVGSLMSHIELIKMKGICEMGPTVYGPYWRRLESLIICGCNCSAFSSVILRL